MNDRLKSEKKLIERLNKTIDLQVPGFTKKVPEGEVGQIVFDVISSEKWYGNFLNRIKDSIGKRYLPVYRMADGEFIFCVGWKPDLPNVQSRVIERLWFKTKGVIKSGVRSVYSRSSTCWGEDYSGISNEDLMRHYVRCLKVVASHGILAIHFTRSNGRFSEQYFEPMCEWFEKNKIEITPDNYISFYFVYALLCGPDSKVLIRNRRLLLVTSADDSKRTRIGEYLMSLGAKTVQFLRISPNRALLDKINLDEIKETVDLVLVAGGIGSVNILDQLKPLNTVCIDIGICMEIFADPSKRGRIFTQPDQPIV
jgi:hypothetical protein